MNEILTLFLQGVGSFGWIIALIVPMLWFRKQKAELLDYADEAMVKAKNFYATEKADFVNSLPQLVGSIMMPSKMSQLGEMSGISRQLKGLEGDMFAEGVNQIVPGAGDIAAKYMQKYPILQQILPRLIQQYAGNKQNPVQNNGQAYSPQW
jgi:hypothetical protein